MTRCRPSLLACAALLLHGPLARADDPAFRALATPVTASWTGLPLRQVAERLSDVGGIAVVIDRRLDPDTVITLDAAAEPLSEAIARVADLARAEVAPYAGHVRLVPRGRAVALAAAERLRAAELRGSGKAFDAVVAGTGAWSWPEGAIPRDLLAAAAAEAGIAIDGLEDIPHDHFPALRLPPLSLADRLDLLLAHFDKRVAWRARPGPRAAPPVVAVVDLPTAAPGAPPVPARSPPRRPAAQPVPPDATTTFTLTVAAPLDELLGTLARRFGVELELDRAALIRAGVAPAEIVRLELEDATRDQLLDAICGPRRLAWRIDGGRLSVSAAAR